jgi:DNA-binding transcriptional LysR family regulator
MPSSRPDAVVRGRLTDVELRQLSYFVAVAEEGSFTKAAARLHIVQSGVSSAIKLLEQELGAQLLDRSARRVELTDAGAAFLTRARATLDAAQEAVDAVQQVRTGLRGTLRIGTMLSVPLLDMPALLGKFHRSHPLVDVRLTGSPSSGSRGLVEGVLAGSLHLAFVALPGPVPAGLHLRGLTSAPIDLVVPSGHPLATKDHVTLADLADEQFVDFPSGYGNRVVADMAFAAAGIDRHVVIEISDIATGAAYVAEGLGVALLPRFIIPVRPDIATLAVTGAALEWPMAVATSTERRLPAAATAFLALLDAEFAPPGDEQRTISDGDS